MSDSHNPHDDMVPATFEDEPIVNPGLPAHTWRPTDVDPKAEKRAERQVATLFGLSMVFAVLFLVSYFVFSVGGDGEADTIGGLGASNVALGATLGGALLFIGIGVIQWARKLMSDHEIVEFRHTAASPEEDREATLAALNAGLEESGIGRRPLIRNTLLGAVGILGLPAIVMLRDLGPLPGDKLQHTIWKTGMRVVQRRRRHPDQGLRPRARRPRQRPAGGAVPLRGERLPRARGRRAAAGRRSRPRSS